MIPNGLSTARLVAAVTLACRLAACRRAPTAAPTPAPDPSTVPLRTQPPLTTMGVHRLVPVPESVAPGGGAPFALTAATVVVVPVAGAGTAADGTGGGEAARLGDAVATLLRPAT